MTEIPMLNDSPPQELRCTTCLLPMRYQTKKDGKFLWQCFRCGKQYHISNNVVDDVEESWALLGKPHVRN